MNNTPIQISQRELEVLQLIAQEKTMANIAVLLHISQGTVETHRRNTMIKLGAKNTAGLIVRAFANKLLITNEIGEILTKLPQSGYGKT